MLTDLAVKRSRSPFGAQTEVCKIAGAGTKSLKQFVIWNIWGIENSLQSLYGMGKNICARASLRWVAAATTELSYYCVR